MSDRIYHQRVATIQGILALVCLLAAIECVWVQHGPWVGLLLSSLTNLILAVEKVNLLRRKPSG